MGWGMGGSQVWGGGVCVRVWCVWSKHVCPKVVSLKAVGGRTSNMETCPVPC